MLWRHDIQHNDIQHNITILIITAFRITTLRIMTFSITINKSWHSAWSHSSWWHLMQNVVMLTVIYAVCLLYWVLQVSSKCWMSLCSITWRQCYQHLTTVTYSCKNVSRSVQLYILVNLCTAVSYTRKIF